MHDMMDFEPDETGDVEKRFVVLVQEFPDAFVFADWQLADLKMPTFHRVKRKRGRYKLRAMETGTAPKPLNERRRATWNQAMGIWIRRSESFSSKPNRVAQEYPTFEYEPVLDHPISGDALERFYDKRRKRGSGNYAVEESGTWEIRT